MCGIVYVQKFDGTPANALVEKQFEAQRSRGVEGFGVFNGKHIIKAAMEKRIKRWLHKKKNESDMLLFHHRWPTSTINVRRAAHPFSTGDYFGDTKYVLVHNGTVSNADALFEEHQNYGIEYSSFLQDNTFNDSEALLWDFALTMEGKQEALSAEGGIAFVCIKLEKGVPTKLYFGRNYSKPLNVLRAKDGIMLSSEGEGDKIKDDTLYTFHYGSKRLTKKEFVIPDGWKRGTTYTGNPSNVPYSYGSDANACYGGDWNSYLNNSYYLDANGKKVHFNDYGSDEYEDYSDAAYDNDYGFDWTGGTTRSKSAPVIGELLTESEINKRRKSRYNSLVAKPDLATQAQSLIFSYMREHGGHYDTVYWALQADYDAFDLVTPTEESSHAQMVILTASEMLEQDPKWIDNNSISDLWLAEDTNPLSLQLATE